MPSPSRVIAAANRAPDHSARDIASVKQRANRHSLIALATAVTSMAMAAGAMWLFAVSDGGFDALMIDKMGWQEWALPALFLIPLGFVLAGQYSGRILTQEADAVVESQASALRKQTGELERRLLHEANHDRLTGLPNRVALFADIERALEAAENDGSGVALLYIDLDRYKEINDTLGYFNGDHLLRQLGGRLRAIVEAPCTAARLGGDEFAILVVRPKELTSREISQDVAIAEYAHQIRHALAAPFAVEHLTFELEATVGAAWVPHHGTDAHTMLRRAELAMFSAKQSPSGYAEYSEHLEKFNPRRLSMMGELRRAISANELELYFQPKVRMSTGRISGAEALARWPQGSTFVSPNEFILLAESTRLIQSLTAWVLDRALRQLRTWRSEGLEVSVAVNLSARDLHDAKLPGASEALLTRHDVAPEWVELEITETSIMLDQRRALSVLTQLHELGTRLAVDDFGTGHSSLAYLSRLPVDTLKIDSSFVAGMTERWGNATIVNATIGLAHDLGLSVTAEGVETQAQWTALAAKGCDEAQGYFIAQPMPASAFAALDGERKQLSVA